MKKDISANVYQKCLILCSKINVLHNLNLTVCYHGNILGSRPPQYLRCFWPPLAFHFHICEWCLVCMIRQAYKYVGMRFWPRLTFLELNIAKILKSSGWGLEKSELPWEQNFYSHKCVCRTINLPSTTIGEHCHKEFLFIAFSVLDLAKA